ncbi:MAG TPA: hypothetical protein VK025_07875 [Steroidobacter sp.]|nr:hypothetical protein [Steroidobacter sp.]
MRRKTKITRRATITPALIELYRRHCELVIEIGMAVFSEPRGSLERIRCEIDHPSQSELRLVRHEIHKALGLSPGDDPENHDAVLAELAARAGHPYAAELEEVERLKFEQMKREAWAHICDGPHPVGWSHDDAVADFHRRYGDG